MLKRLIKSDGFLLILSIIPTWVYVIVQNNVTVSLTTIVVMGNAMITNILGMYLYDKRKRREAESLIPRGKEDIVCEALLLYEAARVWSFNGVRLFIEAKDSTLYVYDTSVNPIEPISTVAPLNLFKMLAEQAESQNADDRRTTED